MHPGKSFWWVLLIFTLSVIGSLVPSNPIKNILEKLTIIWGVFIVWCWVWTFFSLQGLKVKRSVRTLRQAVGEIFIERIEVVNQSRFVKNWVRINDKSELTGPDRNKVITNIGKKTIEVLFYFHIVKIQGNI